jgi:hypothetical protein
VPYRGTVSSLVPRKTPSPHVLYCHYVFYDQHRDFEAVIRCVQSIGTLIGIDELLDILERRRPMEHNLFRLSFDDGLKNVVTNVLSVLREHGVPATFFGPTAIISGSEEQVEKYRRATTNYPSVIEMATWDDLEKGLRSGARYWIAYSHSRSFF